MFDADLDAAVVGRRYRGKGRLRFCVNARLFNAGDSERAFCRIVA